MGNYRSVVGAPDGPATESRREEDEPEEKPKPKDWRPQTKDDGPPENPLLQHYFAHVLVAESCSTVSMLLDALGEKELADKIHAYRRPIMLSRPGMGTQWDSDYNPFGSPCTLPRDWRYRARGYDPTQWNDAMHATLERTKKEHAKKQQLGKD